VRLRPQRAAERPYFTGEDAWLLLELAGLAIVATFVPERHWAALSLRLVKLKARLGLFSPAAIQRGLRLVPGASTDPDDAFRIAATRIEHHLQILREALWGWSAPVRLVGGERIAEALAKGQGAVLWVAHFSFNALATKKALHSAGFEVSHLSRPEHGFSKSRFGIAFLNPIRVKAELKYLQSRIIIDRSRPGRSVQQARRRLEANRLISITAGAWEGLRVVTLSIHGCSLDLSTGAPALSHLTGATLFPVFTVRAPDKLEISVVIGEAIPIKPDPARTDAVLAASQEFADRLVRYVDTYPFQWRDWEKIRATDIPPETPLTR
jgi:lauroyl/myristoyl acyltransferase